MKLRKLISLIVTLTVIMTSAAIVSVPAVSAETVDTDTAYSEDFDDFPNKNYSQTLTALIGHGWYVADNNTLYTEGGAVPPYSTYNYKFARITGVDGSQALQVVSAGEGNNTQNADIPKYGYAKTFPGVPAGEAATGSWEISFDFKPSLINNMTQFAITLNTGDNSDMTEADATHNIIAGYGQRFYLGYRDYNALLNNGVQQGTLKAADIGGLTWYTVKTKLNCDARYYSVELYNRSTGALIARRSPISFASDETIGFLKFSALGFKQESWMYIDNISIEQARPDNSIYNETFEAFTDYSYVAADGMTTGQTAEDVKGSSYFEGYTPWRYHKDIGNSYNLEIDTELTSQVVRLGDKPETTDTVEASGLIYMQANEPLVTRTTQSLRGLLSTSFMIKPETIGDDFTVNVIPDPKIDITADECVFFRIINDEGTPKVINGSGEYAALDASKWYIVTQTFDVLGRTVTTVVKDLEGNIIASSLATGNTTPYAVRGIMFRADGGSSVLMDDIKLEYYIAGPTVNKNNIVLTDRFGKKIPDINNVTTSLKTIEIPFGCSLDAETANASTILLRDSGSIPIPYTGSVFGNSYIMELDSVLGLNEEYTVTIPGTVANTSGAELGDEVTFTFKTADTIMDISAVSVNGEPLGSLSEVTAGSTVSVEVSYNNNTAEAVSGTVILAFYNADKLACVKSLSTTVPAGESGTDGTTFVFTVPSDLDTDAVERMSVFLWTGLRELKPLTQKIDVKKNLN